MIYEWDENKRASNLIKHKLDFVDAMAVFDDPNRIEKIDTRENYGEIRIRTIGMIKDELVVTVIYTGRNNRTRIISARRAKQKERREYYGYR